MNHLLESKEILVIIVSTIATIIIGLFAVFFTMIVGHTDKNRKKELEKYSSKIEKTIPETPSSAQDTRDALALMRLNLENLKEYCLWSQSQAKSAFAVAIIISVVGFFLFGFSVVISAQKGLEAAIIPAVGGAITEFLAATVLFVYRNSLTQLNHYHHSLHEDERFLSSVNLIDQFSDRTIRDSMLREIIRSEIQMNITDSEYMRDSGKRRIREANVKEEKAKEEKPEPEETTGETT